MSYTGGPLEPGQIRVLTLHSGRHGEPINCTMKNVSLEQAARDGYSALSYTWGPPTQPQLSIILNGADVSIGQQLYEALEHLRDSDQAVTLWVDALCINQIDAKEKTVQLPLMGRIYSGATAVEIWLGSAESEWEYDEEWAMRGVASDPEKNSGSIRLMWALSRTLRRPWFSRLWVLQELVLGAPGAVRVRLGRATAPWANFRRLFTPKDQASLGYVDFLSYKDSLRKKARAGEWILNYSEVVGISDLAVEGLHEPMVAVPHRLAGELELHSSENYEARGADGKLPNAKARPRLKRAAEQLDDSSGSVRTSVSVGRMPRFLVENPWHCQSMFRESVRFVSAAIMLRPESADAKDGDLEGNERPELVKLLLEARPQVSTDPRDKIYGLLGMVDDATRTALRPSYEKTKLDVFHDATVYCLTKSSEPYHNIYYYLPNRLPLSDDGGRHGGTTRAGPSWLLDFSYTGREFFEGYLGDDLDEQEAARRKATPSARFLPSDEFVMFVETTVVDTIAHLHTLNLNRTGIQTQDHRSDVVEEPIQRMVRDAYLLYKKGKALAAGSGWARSNPEAFWETLAGPPSMCITVGYPRLVYRDRKVQAMVDHRLHQFAGLGGLMTKGEEEEAFRYDPDEGETAWAPFSPNPIIYTIKKSLEVERPESVKTFFVTYHGVCGICVGRSMVGDLAAVLFRGSSQEVHFILRPAHDVTATNTAPGSPQKEQQFRMVGVARISRDWLKYCEHFGKLEAETVRII